MTARYGMLAFLLSVSALAATADATNMVLQSGDYRWIPLHIRQTPLRVDVSFAVTHGDGTVHAELLPESAFRPMQRGLPHQALAATAEGAAGEFRYVIEDPGSYRIVITNRNGAKPVNVSWRVSTDLNPPVTATELTPRRRIVVIFGSFVLFFAMVGYSGWKLRSQTR